MFVTIAQAEISFKLMPFSEQVHVSTEHSHVRVFLLSLDSNRWNIIIVLMECMPSDSELSKVPGM